MTAVLLDCALPVVLTRRIDDIEATGSMARPAAADDSHQKVIAKAGVSRH